MAEDEKEERKRRQRRDSQRERDEKAYMRDRKKRMKEQEKLIDEQIDNVTKTIRNTFRSRMDEVQKSFSAGIDEQIRNLRNFSNSTSSDMQDQWRSAMKSQQENLQDQLKQMEIQYRAYSSYMNKADKLAYETVYRKRSKELNKLDENISKIYSNEMRSLEDLGKTWDVALSEMSEKLRDIANTLNISKITDSVGEQVDGYVKNLRDMRKRTGDAFDEDWYSDMISSTAKRTGYIMNRNELSSYLSDQSITLNLNDKSFQDYAEGLTNANVVLGQTADSLSNILWMDKVMGQQGKMFQATLDIASSLENAQGTNIRAEAVLETLQENAVAIYGITKGDSKKATAMVKSLANIESAGSSVSGMEGFSAILKDLSTKNVYELMQDDRARLIAQISGMDFNTQYALLHGDAKTTTQYAENALNALGRYNDNEAFKYQLTQSGLAGTVAELSNWTDPNKRKQYIEAMMAGTEAINTSEGSIAKNAQESIGKLDRLGNQVSYNPIVTTISDKFAEWDINAQNLANATIIASGIVDAFKGFRQLGGFKGIFSSVKDWFSGFGGKLGGGLSSIGSKLSGGFSNISSSFSGLGTKLSGIFTGAKGKLASMFGGLSSNTATLGGVGTKLTEALSSASGGMSGLSSLLSTAGPVAGGLWTLVDGVRGMNKSVEWLGKEGGNSLSGKIASGIGGALGGTDSGFSGALKGAGKGALLGAFAGPIGSAIGGALGGVLGAIGGERIAKFAKGALDTVNSVVDASLDAVTGGVNAISGVAKEFGLVGETIGQTLEDSWGAVTDTKKKIEEVWADPNKGIISKIGSSIGAVFGGAGKVVTSLVKNFKNMASKAWDGIKGIASKAWEGIKSAGIAVWDGVKEGLQLFSDMGSKFVESAGSFTEKTGSGIGNIFKGIGDGVGSVFSGIFGGGSESTNFTDKLDISNEYLKLIAENTSDGSNSGLKATAVSGFAQGLSYVPNDGLAMIHKGEAVLTASQAGILRAQADGGILMPSTDEDVLITIIKKAISVSPLADIISPITGLFDNSEISRKENKKFEMSLRGGGSITSGGGLFGNFLRKIVGGVSNLLGGGKESGASKSNYNFNLRGSGSTIVPAVDTGNNQRTVWNFLTGNGFTPEATAGVMGNLMQESGRNIDPNATEKGYDNWRTMADVKHGGAGIAQWTYPSRCADFDNFMSAKGYNPRALTSQLEFMLYEADKMGVNVAGMTDIDQACLAWESQYEGAGVPMMSNRLKYAHEVYDKFAKYAVGTPFIPEDQIAVLHKGEMVVPAESNPFNTTTSTNIIHDSKDNSDVVETLKWMVARLESKLDQVIASSGKNSTRKPINTYATDTAFSV